MNGIGWHNQQLTQWNKYQLPTTTSDSSETGGSSTCRRGQLVFVPLGKLLIMPSDTIHGGGFRTRPIFNNGIDVGNLRYHLYLATDGHGLPQFVNNTYTQKNDRRRELCDIYRNASGLDQDSCDDEEDAAKHGWQSSALLMDLLLD